MGTKRVEGRKKKKSLKAKVTSKFSAKRKLSRNGKKLKKGMMGPSTEFITRSAVIKKLQITLKDFRRLCILKGIYPRVPPKAPIQGSDKIYYDIKDISYLAHEPLLMKFREFKAFMKKIRKAAGRNQFEEARRKDRLKPNMTLDHLVRERYPRFIDALRDLDDALCMIHLFASLPSVGRVTAERTAKCQELCLQWQYICMKQQSLRKVFVSVKGVYFQVEIMGETITWVQPHSFTQTIPSEVDLRVMMTFLEFYEVFLKFVLFKLYAMENFSFPPVVDKELYDAGCHLLSLKVQNLHVGEDASPEFVIPALPTTESAKPTTSAADKKSSKISAELLASLNSKLTEIASHQQGVDESAAKKSVAGSGVGPDEDADDDDDEETGHLEGPLSDIFNSLHKQTDQGADDRNEEEQKIFQLSADSDANKTNLFQKLRFFVNREVPLPWMQFCILSFGGAVGWENEISPYQNMNESITHHIVDRPVDPTQPLYSIASREYVQPQWVLDSINTKMLVPAHYYKPGQKLPPHLSPFVDDEKEGYLPKYREELNKLKTGVATGVSGAVVTTAETALTTAKGKNTKPVQEEDDDDDDDNGDDDDDDEEEIEEEKYVEKKTAKGVTKGPKAVVFQPSQQQLSEVGVLFKCIYLCLHIFVHVYECLCVHECSFERECLPSLSAQQCVAGSWESLLTCNETVCCPVM